MQIGPLNNMPVAVNRRHPFPRPMSTISPPALPNAHVMAKGNILSEITGAQMESPRKMIVLMM
jgi:hypothetical protein